VPSRIGTAPLSPAHSTKSRSPQASRTGSSSPNTPLIKGDLVEEVHFWVHPIVWSEPSRPFHGLGHVRMNRKDTTVFRSGVTLQNYEPVSVEE
jgi:hypothetical protein